MLDQEAGAVAPLTQEVAAIAGILNFLSYRFTLSFMTSTDI